MLYEVITRHARRAGQGGELIVSLRRPQMVLLDLDGTLVDSVPDLAVSVNRMMAQLGRPAHSETSVRHWVGNGVERLVMRALTGA